MLIVLAWISNSNFISLVLYNYISTVWKLIGNNKFDVKLTFLKDGKKQNTSCKRSMIALNFNFFFFWLGFLHHKNTKGYNLYGNFPAVLVEEDLRCPSLHYISGTSGHLSRKFLNWPNISLLPRLWKW